MIHRLYTTYNAVSSLRSRRQKELLFAMLHVR